MNLRNWRSDFWKAVYAAHDAKFNAAATAHLIENAHKQRKSMPADHDSVTALSGKLRTELLLSIVNTATDLCEEIRANGTHETWKPLAHALDALEEANG